MATPWTVKIPAPVQREIDRLPNRVRTEIRDILLDLMDDPYLPDALELRKNPGMFRIRLYDNAYRLLYSINPKRRLVVLFRARTRSDAYDGLRNP